MKIWVTLFLILILTTSCIHSNKKNNNTVLSKQDSMTIYYEMQKSDSSKLDFYTTKDKFIFFENK